MPAVMLTLVLLLAYSLVQSEMLWKLLEWLIFEPQPTPTPEPTSSTEPEATPPTDTETQSDLESFKERVTRAFPLITMGMYAALSLGLVYSSSMMLARQYVNRMNGDLPKPIFRQDEKLAQVVRREAEIELGRQNPDDLHPSGKNVSRQRYVEFNGQFDPGHLLPGPKGKDGPFPSLELWAQDDTWTWDELERTEDGGVKMKVARQDIYRLPTPQESCHQPHPLVCYVVRANHWGRIKSIERVSDSENDVTG